MENNSSSSFSSHTHTVFFSCQCCISGWCSWALTEGKLLFPQPKEANQCSKASVQHPLVPPEWKRLREVEEVEQHLTRGKTLQWERGSSSRQDSGGNSGSRVSLNPAEQPGRTGALSASCRCDVGRVESHLWHPATENSCSLLERFLPVSMWFRI